MLAITKVSSHGSVAPTMSTLLWLVSRVKNQGHVSVLARVGIYDIFSSTKLSLSYCEDANDLCFVRLERPN